MVHRFAKLFRSSAGPKIQPVYSEAMEKRLLSETLNVACIGTTFQAMQKGYLASARRFRLMFECKNRRLIVDPIMPADRVEMPLIDLPGPEIPRDCEEMRVSEDRLEIWRQIQLYRRGPDHEAADLT